MGKSKYRILVLDGGHKNALAIVRHLGQTRNYIIDVVSVSNISICFFSKYIENKFVIRSPKANPGDYIEDLIDILKTGKYLVVLPVSYISYQLCSEHKERILEYTKITIADAEKINLASSKIDTYKLAEKIGIPYPAITEIESPDEIENANITYPCVIKAPIEVGKTIVEYVRNKDELIKKFRKIVRENDFNKLLPVVQHFIEGDGVGFFAFYKNGKCINYFVHKRIREYPVTGGASTVAESFHDPYIIEKGKKILDFLNWEGVAMVEFKKDNTTGVYNLMEINAKFWGSLDLALVAGVNFPQMLIDDALGQEIEVNDGFKNKRFQWILNGDLFHVFERPWHLFAFIKDLFTAENGIYLTDLKPNLFQLIYIPIHYYKKWFK